MDDVLKKREAVNGLFRTLVLMKTPPLNSVPNKVAGKVHSEVITMQRTYLQADNSFKYYRRRPALTAAKSCECASSCQLTGFEAAVSRNKPPSVQVLHAIWRRLSASERRRAP